jgi:phospholipid/cholesterol/gamma-HCH transport system substrate-binding protein
LKISKELKVAFFFILAVVILVWGFNFLKGKDLFSSERMFYTVYKNVGGLEQSNSIFINGVKVGSVSKVYFEKSMNGDIIVELNLKNDFPIPRNSVSRIFSQDLMGSRGIEIILGDSPEMAKSGDTLKTDVEVSLKDAVNQQILPLKIKAEDLISSIDTMVVAIQGVFNKDIRDELLTSVRSIRQTFQNLESTTGELDTLVNTQAGRISHILYNLDAITNNLEQNSGQISATLNNLATISDSLAKSNIPQIMANLDRTIANLASISTRIEKGEGTIGMLVNDDKLYKDLEKAAMELNSLVEDIRLNPKRYVRVSVF